MVIQVVRIVMLPLKPLISQEISKEYESYWWPIGSPRSRHPQLERLKFHLRNFMNPYVDMQAQDRTNRIGQKKEVQVFRFCTEV
ncbi:hypothetical protein GOBAR_AA22011 [Gossypium barbadense]|uniref:Uncharacterized protein n=1 Tax=Gossypium barbadense TaxID=3634 RepID=A0A2P5X5Q6_GOSBA|nr:hypothetical protein GOBAR_AA22011 [Gossypium barbadense]